MPFCSGNTDYLSVQSPILVTYELDIGILDTDTSGQ